MSVSVNRDTLDSECREIPKGNVQSTKYDSLHLDHALGIGNTSFRNTVEVVSLVTVSKTKGHGIKIIQKDLSRKLKLHQV